MSKHLTKLYWHFLGRKVYLLVFDYNIMYPHAPPQAPHPPNPDDLISCQEFCPPVTNWLPNLQIQCQFSMESKIYVHPKVNIRTEKSFLKRNLGIKIRIYLAFNRRDRSLLAKRNTEGVVICNLTF